MKNDNNMLQNVARPWYKRPSRIVILIVTLIALWLIAAFIGQVRIYSEQIALEQITTEGFSEISGADSINDITPARISLETMSDPTFGNPDAKIVIVEFGDFQCPFCSRAFPIIRSLQQKYQDQILFIWRDLPLTDIHPDAQRAAEAGECAHEQGKFWEYHDKLFINQHDLSLIALKAYALEIGLDAQKFNICVDSRKYASEVDDDLQTALSSGAIGTPTFFINGQIMTGTPPEKQFAEILEQLIQQAY